MSAKIMLMCRRKGPDCIETQYTLAQLQNRKFRICGHRIADGVYEKAIAEINSNRVARSFGTTNQKRISK